MVIFSVLDLEKLQLLRMHYSQIRKERNFSTYIPMPFKTGMKITVTNESSVLIKHFYYDIDYTLGDKFTEDTLYFHAYFNRENFTNLKKDFELLPYVEGKGRYLGTNMGVRCNTKLYSDTWWGRRRI